MTLDLKPTLVFLLTNFCIISLKRVDVKSCCFISTLIKDLKTFSNYQIMVNLFWVLLILNSTKID